MRITKLIILFLVISFHTSILAQMVIDDFSTDQALIFSVGSPSSASSFVAGTSIGGERDLEVSVTAGAVASGEVTGGTFNFGLAAGTTGNSLITWDGSDGLPASGDIDFVGLGGIDLTNGGIIDGITVTVDSTDVIGSLELTVYTDAANSSNFSFTLPAGIVTSTKFFIPISSFGTNSGTGADFSNVGAITMSITGTALDAAISLVQAETSLTASMTDALLIDNDFDGVASPGDRIRYTTTVTNPDDALDLSSTGVFFNISPDTNTTLVVGSVTTTQGIVTTGNTGGDTTVSVNSGIIADAASVTMTFDVQIDLPLASSITQVSAQGTVTSTNITGGLSTDDPAVAGITDTTNTPITKTVVGNFIWNDLNGDGVQDGGGETGISGVTLDAYFDVDGSGTISGGDILLANTTTDGSGNYGFGLPNYLEFIVDVTDTGNVLTGLSLTGGTDPNAPIIVAGGTDNTIDFGYQAPTGSIGDFVWNDLNGNGVQDGGGEIGINGVTIDLYSDNNGDGLIDGGDTFIDTQTSAAGGAYDFTGLSADDYIVDVTDTGAVLAGFALTTTNDPLAITLSAGQDFNNADFGYRGTGTIGDFVWNDLNGNSTQDGGLEGGIDGVTLDLYRDNDSSGTVTAGDTLLASQTTMGGGAYDFTGLSPNDYIVDVTDTGAVLTGFTLTTANDPFTTTLTAGEDENSADFGYQQQNATIGDLIYNDLNGNGAFNAGEPGVAGVTVFIDLNANAVVDSGEPFDITDGTGAYDIISLATGSYSVRIDNSTRPAGFVTTTINHPLLVNLAIGEDFNAADFGIQQQDASIGDLVFNDLNGNGVLDGLETGLSGVIVYIDDNLNGMRDVLEEFTTTFANGSYDLLSLATGTYSIAIDATTIPAGFVLTTANNPASITLANSEDFNTADFGFQLPVELSINDVSAAEGTGANTSLSFEVSLSNSSASIVTVDFDTVDDSALSPSDFVSNSGTLTFAAGTTSQILPIEIAGDYLIENDESFTVVLSAPNNASIDDGTGIGTIENDDLGADLSLTMDITPIIAEVNDILTYTVQVINNGPESAIDAITTINLFDKVQFINAITPQGMCAHVSAVVTCQLGDVNNGQIIDIIIQARVIGAGNINAEATVNSTSDDTSTGNNIDTIAATSSALPIPTLSQWSLLVLMLLLLIISNRKTQLIK
jgi:hypothetical protein